MVLALALVTPVTSQLSPGSSQGQATRFVYGGLFIDDGLTPIDRDMTGPEPYAVLQGTMLNPVTVVRNLTASLQTTKVYLVMRDLTTFAVVYNESVMVSIDAEMDKTVKMPPWIVPISPSMDPGGTFGTDDALTTPAYQPEWKKGDGEQLQPQRIRSGKCFFTNLSVVQQPNGGLGITKTIINLKQGPCPWSIKFYYNAPAVNSARNLIDSVSGPGPVGAGPTDISLKWFPPAPGTYCITTDFTIQGHVVHEWFNNIVVKNPPPPPPVPPPPPPPPPPGGWPPLPPGAWWYIPLRILPDPAFCNIPIELIALQLQGTPMPYVPPLSDTIPCSGEQFSYLPVYVPDASLNMDSSVFTVVGRVGGLEIGSLTIRLKPESAPNTLRGVKFSDLNGNGIKDPGEPGLAGWKINLSGTASGSAVTDSMGNYSFSGLAPGTYCVDEVAQPGWTKTKPAANYCIALGSGQVIDTLDFGNHDIVPPTIAAHWLWDDIEYENRFGPFYMQTDVSDNSTNPQGAPDSFFDVFFDVSTNSGSTWSTTQMALNPNQEPGAFQGSALWWALAPVPPVGYPPGTILTARIRSVDKSGNASIVPAGAIGIIPPRPIIKPLFPAPFKRQGDYEAYWYGKASNSWCVPTSFSSCLQRLGVPGLPTDKTELVKALAREMGTDNIQKNAVGKGSGVRGVGTFILPTAQQNGIVLGMGKYLTQLNQRQNYSIKVYEPNESPGLYVEWGADTVYGRYPTYEDYKRELHQGEDVIVLFGYGPKSKAEWHGGHAVVGIGQIDSVAGTLNSIVVMDPVTGDTARISWNGNEGKYGGTRVTIKCLIVISPKPKGGQIYGTKFADQNGNGVKDSGEVGLRGWLIKLSPLGYYALTDSTGKYCFMNLQPGMYTVTEAQRPNWQPTCPPGGAYQFPLAENQIVTGLDFCNRLIGGPQDLCVQLAAGRARPGFKKLYSVFYQNAGLVKTPGTVVLTLPVGVNYVSSSLGGVYAPGPRTVTWSLGSLLPGANGWLWVQTMVKMLPLGTPLTSCVRIEPIAGDVNPANNQRCETQIVRGSFDPNDKSVVPAGVGPYQTVTLDDTLTYQIRFQNTGTDTAFTVVLRDTIDSNLDLGTLQPGASSHPFTLDIVGRELIWTFSDILLPDSTTDEPGSHGYAWYDIQPDSGTPVGTDIVNRAGIYFDFNPPVITNAQTNRIGSNTTLSVTASWNLLSSHIDAADKAKTSMFPTALTPAYDYDQILGYQPASTIENGVAYWLKFGSPQAFNILGSPLTSLNIPVQTGWNMIGSVAGSVTVGSIGQAPSSIVTSIYYRYTTSYEGADTLEAGEGYWVKTNADGQLSLTAGLSSVPSPGASSPMRVIEGMNRLTITDASGASQRLYFGSSEIAKLSPGMFDMPPLPPAGSFDVRFATQRLAEFVDEGGSRVIPISLTSVRYPISLRWETKPQWRGGSTLLLADRRVVMGSAGSTTIAQPVSNVSLALTSDGTGLVPVEYALHQNYPNPFNPSTTIRFDLPEAASVTLKVYTMLGQEVTALLLSQPYDAGRHVVEFDASALASGMYAYRLTAGSFSDSKVMMLVR